MRQGTRRGFADDELELNWRFCPVYGDNLFAKDLSVYTKKLCAVEPRFDSSKVDCAGLVYVKELDHANYIYFEICIHDGVGLEGAGVGCAR